MNKFSLNELKLAIDIGCSQFEDNEMVVVGSMSLLGHAREKGLPHPIELTMDIDLYPKKEDTLGLAKTRVALDYGEGSQFRQEHGWYIEVLGKWTTDRTPPGWMDRTNKVTTDKGNVGHCLAPLDLAYNKATVARAKDYDQVKAMIGVGYVSYGDLKKLLSDFPPTLDQHRENARQFMTKLGSLLNEAPLPEIPHVPAKGEHFYPTGAGKTGYATK